MKHLYFMAVLLAAVNIYMFTGKEEQRTRAYGIFDVEALSNSENDKKYCHSGGIAASQCSIEGGISLDAGISGGCSVTCNSGYYACCDLHCTCEPY